MVVAPPALVAAARMLQPAPPSSLLQTVRPQPSPSPPPPSSSSSSSAPFFSYSLNEKALSGLRAQRKSASLPSPLRSAYGQRKNAFLLVVQCADTNGFCTRSLSGQDNVGAVVNQGSQHDFVVEDEAGSVLADAGNNLGILTADITTRTDEYASSDAGNDLGIVTAKITSRTDEFFSSEKDGDPDCPSEGFYSIVEAVDAIRQGKLVIVVDDEERENEGDLIMAGSLVTPEAMAFLVKHGTGIVCAAMKGKDLDRLKLPLMVEEKENEEALRTAFTVTVDVRAGTTTGVSASDRAKTIQALACPDSKPEHFRKPGHIFPLRYREGGVLKRAGHTEAAVDLTRMAGLSPIGVLCEIVDEDDGSMARLPKLRAFAQKHSLPLISITDLVRYQRKREKLVERTAVARMPTKWGTFLVYGYRSKLDGIEHVAMVKGDIGNGLDVLVRVHSECLTGDIFGSARCDCGNQLALAMQNIEKAGRGVLVYLRGHEGRGIGLGHKLRAYNLQDEGRDTVEANVELGLPVDSREYGIGAQILRDVGVQTMKLMTNNPSKYVGLRGYGLAVTSRIPVLSPITLENQRYLETKRSKMGHIYGSDLPGSIVGFKQSGTSSSKMDPLS